MLKCKTTPDGTTTVCFNADTGRWEINNWFWQKTTKEPEKQLFHDVMQEYFGKEPGREWDEVTPYELSEWITKLYGGPDIMYNPLQWLKVELERNFCIGSTCLHIPNKWVLATVVGGIITGIAIMLSVKKQTRI